MITPSSTATSRRPDMLGAFPGFRRGEDVLMDDETTMADSEVYLTPSPDRHPLMEPTDTVAASSGSVVEEQPLEGNGTANKEEKKPGFRCRWWYCVGVLAVLAVVCILVVWLILKEGNNNNSRVSNASIGGDESSKTMAPTSTPTWSTSAPSPVMEPGSSFVTLTPTKIPATFEPSSSSSSGGSTIHTTGPTFSPSAVPSSLPSGMPSSANFASIVQQLKSLLDLTVDIDDTESPQFKAVTWLAEKDQILPAIPTIPDFLYGRRLAQRYALALLYFSTKGEDKWNDKCSFMNETLHECQWKCHTQRTAWAPQDQALLEGKGITVQGVHCYNFSGFRDEIEHLILADNGLSGSLPTELHELIALRSLWLFQNHLTGSIPTTLVANPFLEEVRLESNALTGQAVPWEDMSAISFLRDWRAANNKLSGPLPKHWQMASRLEILDLGHNFLTGEIIHEFWYLPMLRRVSLPFNKLNETLPASLGQHLEVVDLEMNQFSGELPAHLDDAQPLTTLNLRGNNFSGGIPESWTGLDDLEYMDVSGNPGLYGSIEFFCNTPRAGQFIHADCDIIPCSCCLCV